MEGGATVILRLLENRAGWAALAFCAPGRRLAAMGIKGVAGSAPLPFFIWGAREMFRSFRDTGRSQ